jgi:hypothetical protein
VHRLRHGAPQRHRGDPRAVSQAGLTSAPLMRSAGHPHLRKLQTKKPPVINRGLAGRGTEPHPSHGVHLRLVRLLVRGKELAYVKMMIINLTYCVKLRTLIVR